MLWLRNNFSTFSSQIIDTFTVVGLLCVFGVIPWNMFYGLVVTGVIFMIFVAFVDTPLLYFLVFVLKSRFKLEVGGEIDLEK